MKTRNQHHALALGLLAALAGLAGCRGDRSDSPPRQFLPDMDDSPKFKAQSEAPFFADGRAMRPAVAGTVAFSRVSFDPGAHESQPWAAPFLTDRKSLLRDDRGYYEGTDENGDFLNTIPFPVTREMILRGQERFNIYCSACHGYFGDGRGMVAQRWAAPVPSYHDPKYSDPAQRTGKDGYLFHTARNGVPEVDPAAFPKMPGYGHALSEADTWAVVAYIRVLQAWQGGSIDQVPPSEREALVKAREAWLAANPPPADGPPPAEGAAPGGAQ
jgi:mono/diheme cytochrome c family protein